LEIPNIVQIKSIDTLRDITQGNSEDCSCIDMAFRGEFSGTAQLVFSTKDAGKLVSLFTGEKNSKSEFNDLMKSSLTEIGNIVLNSLVGTMGNIFKTRIEYYMPTFSGQYNRDLELADKIDKNLILLAKTLFTISEVNIIGSFIFFLEISSVDHFVELVNNSYLAQ
jgi:chemotaxis protein CheC